MTVRLLIVNYSIDPNNTIFGHQLEIVEKLCEKFDSITVLSAYGRRSDDIEYLQDKKFSHFVIGWREGKKVHNFIRSYYILFKSIFFSKPQIVFFHMTDTLAALYAPVFSALKVPQLLWYAHASNSKSLIFVRWFIKEIVSSTPGSFPQNDSNVLYIGQSINPSLFSFRERCLDDPVDAVYFGRLDPSKHLEKVIKSLLINSKSKDLVKTFTIFGSPSNINAEEYKTSLETQFKDLISNNKLIFRSSIERNSIPEATKNFNLFVHAFEGSLDKVLLEATLLGIPVITLNQEFMKEVGAWSSTQSSLEEELLSYFARNIQSRKAEVLSRYRLVAQNHNLDCWIEKLSDELRRISGQT